MGTEDVKLARRCLKGDARAWEGIVDNLQGKILNMAYHYTGRFDIAEELTQDIFVKVYQNLSSYKPTTGPLRNWVMRVGRNLLIDHYRSTRHDRQVAGSEELEKLDFARDDRDPNPFESLHAKERAGFLMRGLSVLTPELREAVTLRDLQGFTYQEIADLLKIPEGTVKSRINRGRIELAKSLRSMRPAAEAPRTEA